MSSQYTLVTITELGKDALRTGGEGLKADLEAKVLVHVLTGQGTFIAVMSALHKENRFLDPKYVARTMEDLAHRGLIKCVVPPPEPMFEIVMRKKGKHRK